MRYTITGRNVNVTPGLRAAIEEKIGKLDRYFNPDTEVIVTLSVQKDRQKIEVTIPVKGNIIRAEESSSDMYVSIDLVEEIIERQMKKYKNKLIDKKQSAQAFSALFLNEEVPADEEIQIGQSKTLCHEAYGSGRSLCTDGTSGPQFLRIPECRDRTGKCSL